MNTLKFEDYLKLHLGYTTLSTSQNNVVNLAVSKLPRRRSALPARSTVRKTTQKRPSASDTGQKQEVREASENNTLTQPVKILSSTLS